MRDQWRAVDDHAETQHHRPRNRSRRRHRSPLSSRRRDHEHPGRGRRRSSSHRHARRQFGSLKGDRRPSPPEVNVSSSHHPDIPKARDAKHFQEQDQVRRPRQREDSLPPSQQPPPPTGPPSKRRRSRSPSPDHSRRAHRSKRRDFVPRDRSGREKRPQPRENSPNGRPSSSPRRNRQPDDSSRVHEPLPDWFRPQNRSRSPRAQEDIEPPIRGRSRSRSPVENESRSSRPSSHHSIHTKISGTPAAASRPHRNMQRPIQSVVNDTTRSSFRPISGYDTTGSVHGDNDSMRDSFTMHPSDARVSRHPARPRFDSKQAYDNSPQYVTPTTSRHASPQAGSPYSSGRNSWGGQQPPHSSYPQRFVLFLSSYLQTAPSFY